MAKYELIYFNGKGRAEVTRLMFAAKGIEYKDERIASESWPAIKPNMPQNTLPVLKVVGKDGEVMYGQSAAIDRFVARELGMYGSNNAESTKIDEICETCGEIISKIQPYMTGPLTDEKARGLQEAFTKTIQYETFLANLLRSHGKNGFFVGGQLSLADVIVFRVYDLVKDLQYLDGRDPEIKAHYERIGATPGIAKWIAERPQTKF